MAQKHVFGLFKKITSLVLSGSSYGSLTSWENCMTAKNLVYKVKAKMALSQWDFSIHKSSVFH